MKPDLRWHTTTRHNFTSSQLWPVDSWGNYAGQCAAVIHFNEKLGRTNLHCGPIGRGAVLRLRPGYAIHDTTAMAEDFLLV